MQKPLRLLLGVVALIGFVGCAGPGTWSARGRDLADCFTLTVSAGPEVSASLALTDACHLMIGGGLHAEAGLIGRRVGAAGVLNLGLPVAPFLEDGILHGRYLFTENSGAWRSSDVQDECYLIHAGGWSPTNPPTSALRAWDLEFGLTVLVGARIGFSPGEFFDLLAGLFGADPAGDDPVGD